MRVISPLLKRVVYPGLSKSGYFRRTLPGGVAVLTYHGVLPEHSSAPDPIIDGCFVTPQAFRAQLQLLRTEYDVISPADFLKYCQHGIPLPPRSVLLTCDDGLRTASDDMVPVLEEMEMECLFFIVGAALSARPSMLWHEELYLMLVAGTAAELEIPGVLPRTSVREVAAKRTAWSALLVRLSRVDGESRLHIFNEIRSRLGLGRNWAEEFIDSNDRQRRFLLMQRSDIAKLLSSGMTIGAHSLTHTVLANMPAELARQEIAGSKSLLERNFGCSIWGFAYPFGDVSAVSSRELAIANESDYACAFINVGGGFGATCPRYAIPRIHVRRDMSLAEFEAHLSGFHRNLQEKFSRQAREYITA